LIFNKLKILFNFILNKFTSTRGVGYQHFSPINYSAT